MRKLGFTLAVLASTVPFPSSAQTDPNAGAEAAVRAAFAEAPEMIDVARCESGFRQFGPDGNVLRGGAGGGYLGIFQIGERIHSARALSQGHDLASIVGNIAYAKAMHAAQGTAPWKGCLKPRGPEMPTPVTAPVPASDMPRMALTVDLKFGQRHAQVMELQRQLHRHGFTVAVSGPGSPGQETGLFGSLTREAVRKFQCAKGIACTGDERTTGHGRVGPMTRAALSKAAS